MVRLVVRPFGDQFREAEAADARHRCSRPRNETWRISIAPSAMMNSPRHGAPSSNRS
jgi:hypothetical protein